MLAEDCPLACLRCKATLKEEPIFLKLYSFSWYCHRAGYKVLGGVWLSVYDAIYQRIDSGVVPTLLSHKFIFLIPYKQVMGNISLCYCLLMCKSSSLNYVLFMIWDIYNYGYILFFGWKGYNIFLYTQWSRNMFGPQSGWSSIQMVHFNQQLVIVELLLKWMKIGHPCNRI